ncbi:ArsR/SmtB family transcription factor [Nonomuraea polychroma]|uniref:ArsR/SmtB family transcription factor n=1 Tax=Nonomuraea polychroma TaxID=46176 RepID=UPI003D92B07B
MEERLAALERRIEKLEEQRSTAPAVSARPEATAALELVRHFRERAVKDGTAGTVAYGGAARVNGHEYMWTGEQQVGDLLQADWTAAAAVLESMGSPPRLALLAALVGGPRNRGELQEALGGESSTGHLYHHLRELQRAGLIRQRRRGTYEALPQSVIPFLAIAAAALDLGPGPVEDEAGPV